MRPRGLLRRRRGAGAGRRQRAAAAAQRRPRGDQSRRAAAVLLRYAVAGWQRVHGHHRQPADEPAAGLPGAERQRCAGRRGFPGRPGVVFPRCEFAGYGGGCAGDPELERCGFPGGQLRGVPRGTGAAGGLRQLSLLHRRPAVRERLAAAGPGGPRQRAPLLVPARSAACRGCAHLLGAGVGHARGAAGARGEPTERLRPVPVLRRGDRDHGRLLGSRDGRCRRRAAPGRALRARCAGAGRAARQARHGFERLRLHAAGRRGQPDPARRRCARECAFMHPRQRHRPHLGGQDCGQPRHPVKPRRGLHLREHPQRSRPVRLQRLALATEEGAALDRGFQPSYPGDRYTLLPQHGRCRVLEQRCLSAEFRQRLVRELRPGHYLLQHHWDELPGAHGARRTAADGGPGRQR